VLKGVDTVAGYTTYVKLVAEIIQGKRIIQTAMQKEVDRVAAAIEAVQGGESCAIISSGDPGVYAMAGLVFEMCRGRGLTIAPLAEADENAKADEALHLEVVPGIPALCSGASLLGAPLTHDFAAISLSDLLTPWERITKRLEAAARADFVIVLYNPKSRKRQTNLPRAQEILLQHKDPLTPVGIVTGAMRSNQRVAMTTLGDLHLAEVDMQTTVFIGSSASERYLNFMFTPRGYTKKYTMAKGA
jgi:precorrin-3B C17-methyltransferase